MALGRLFKIIVVLGTALLLMVPPVMAREANPAAAKQKPGSGVGQVKKAKVKAAAKKEKAQLAVKKKKTKSTKAASKKRMVRAARKAEAAPVAAAKAGSAVHQVRTTGYYGEGVQGASYLREQLTSRSAVVMDAATGDLLYAHNPDLPGQPASTIKVLTGLIALKSLHDEELVPASKQAARMPRSKIYLRPGKKYVANDLINAVLLASANDASVALAERIAGSERAFAKLMTKKAEALGATNTVCKTANGLTAPGQQTTAHDLAMIFRLAMRDDEFSRRMAFAAVKTSDGRLLRSHNKALWQIDGAEGGKTGYTDVARKTYVGKFSRNGHEIIVSLMGSESMWTDIRQLVEFGFRAKAHGVAEARRHDRGGERRHSTLRLADQGERISSL